MSADETNIMMVSPSLCREGEHEGDRFPRPTVGLDREGKEVEEEPGVCGPETHEVSESNICLQDNHTNGAV